MSPFVFFWVASFFIGGLFDEPLCIFWDCLFFHWRSILMSHFAFFWVVSFFIGGLF
jgi:hypothetical protein